jgi:hypothetical protein
MKDEIAVDQLRRVGARLLAFEHPQQIGGVRQLSARGHRFQSVAQTRMRGDDHRRLRGQAYPLADHGVAGIVRRVGIERGERRGRGTQHIHRMRRFDGVDDVEDRRGKFPRDLQLSVELRKLRLIRQLAVQQQPGGLLETRTFGKVVDRIAAIAQFADAAVNERARRAVEINALQSAVNLDRFVCFSH